MFSHKHTSPDGMLIMMNFEINCQSPITHVKLAASQNSVFTVIFMSCWSLCVSMNKIHQGVWEELRTQVSPYILKSKINDKVP